MGEVTTPELLADEFPDVNFVIPHLGSFADDWSAQLAFTHLLAERSTLYTTERNATLRWMARRGPGSNPASSTGSAYSHSGHRDGGRGARFGEPVGVLGSSGASQHCRGRLTGLRALRAGRRGRSWRRGRCGLAGHRSPS